MFVALMFVSAPAPASALSVQTLETSRAEQLNSIATVLQGIKNILQLWKESPLAFSASLAPSNYISASNSNFNTLPKLSGSNITLVSSTEKKQVYNINYSLTLGAFSQTSCYNKEYKPNIGGGLNIIGPYPFPVKLTLVADNIDDNLMVDGQIVDAGVNIPSGAKCSYNHPFTYSKTIPAGYTTTLSAVDQHAVAVAMSGVLTLEDLSYVLTITKPTTNTGTGVITGATSGDKFAAGTSVTLTAKADMGSTFVGWGGAFPGTGPYTFTMNYDQTVTPIFTKAGNKLTLTKTVGYDTGILTASPAPDLDGTYKSGTKVTVTATPNSNSIFGGFGGACYGLEKCEVIMDGSKEVIGTFLQKFTLNLYKLGLGSGTVSRTGYSRPRIIPPSYSIELGAVSCRENCSYEYTKILSNVSLGAIPDAGSVFGGFNGDCSGTGACLFTTDASRNIYYTFSKTATTSTTTSATLTVTKPATNTGSGTITSSPAGIDCGVTCQKTFPASSYVTLTAVPNAGSTFSWGGECLGAIGNVCYVNMGTNLYKNVIGIFTAGTTATSTNILTVTKTGSGTVTSTSVPSVTNGINCGTICVKSYASSTKVTLTATPATGYVFIKWSGDVTGTNATTSVVMDRQKYVNAEFGQLYSLTVTKKGTGTVTSSSTPSVTNGINCGTTCVKSYGSGTSVVLTAVPYTGYRFVKWSGNVTGSTTAATTTVTMNAKKKVSAEFVSVCPTFLPKLRTKMKSLQAAALKDDFESGTLMVCFNDGTAKEYPATTIYGTQYVLFDESIENVKNEISKYKGIYSIVSLHNHPLPLMRKLNSIGYNILFGSGFPPSTDDYNKLLFTLNNHINVGTQKLYSYVLDGESKIWQYDIPFGSNYNMGQLANARSQGMLNWGCFETVQSCDNQRAQGGSVSVYLDALRRAGVNVNIVSMP